MKQKQLSTEDIIRILRPAANRCNDRLGLP
jgi:hypothetical protein